jgi:2-polyprenyl-3-methyl-5-hydroxy-6-metoxy-1,4-benzoquinol methylase
MVTSADDNLAEEAHAFDRQIEERIANGHIPDLRTCTPCDWFYNNPWRRPAYVQLDFGEQFELIRDAIVAHAPAKARARVLEVGCGPGYLSLELARAGFDVTGLDLSPKCIEIARHFAAIDPYAGERGALQYVAGDFFTDPSLVEASFDAIVFLGALHHFPAQDAILDRVARLLKPGGVVLAHEPVRDRVTRGNAAFVHLLRVLLSANGGFFKQHAVPPDAQTREREIESLFDAMRYETEEGEKVQSVNDNEAGFAEMAPALRARFAELHFSWRYAFFHEFIGGLRFGEGQNVALARYLRDMDRTLCELGVLSATEFFFVGRKAQEPVR